MELFTRLHLLHLIRHLHWVLLETYVQLPLELQPFIPVLSNPLPDQQQVQMVVQQFCDAWVGHSHPRLQQFAECDRRAVADRNSWLKTTEKTSALQLLFRAFERTVTLVGNEAIRMGDYSGINRTSATGFRPIFVIDFFRF